MNNRDVSTVSFEQFFWNSSDLMAVVDIAGNFVLVNEASPAERITHGAVAALADGVGGAKGGRIAAELACRSFIDAYYSLPATLGVAVAAERALSSFNSWLNAMGAADPDMAGAATTFSALVLRGRFAHLVHVGDSRAWLLRDGVLDQLSIDHNPRRPEHSHILHRAVGLEQTLRRCGRLSRTIGCF